MRALLKNYRIILLVFLLVASFLSLTFNGLKLGVDLSGGTLFQIHLAEKVKDPAQLDTIKRIIEKRLDWTGLKDTTATAWGDEFIVVQIAETNPSRIEELEVLLRKQGKFEATIDGNVIFTGKDILRLPKDAAQGYGLSSHPEGFRWTMPFILDNSSADSAAKRFARMAFHRCTLTGYDIQQGRSYDCDMTYFFIDRPAESILVMPRDLYKNDKELLLAGNLTEDIPTNIEIEELLLNAQTPYVLIDENTSSAVASLQELISTHDTAIIPDVLDAEFKEKLSEIGFKLKELKVEGISKTNYSEFGTQNIYAKQIIPWVWQSIGAKQVISLSPDIANLDPYVDDVKNAEIFPELIIRGFAPDEETARQRLRETSVILESGSLPVGVDNVSKETISPLLGEEFMKNTFTIGLVGLLVVVLVVYFRYRVLKIAAPIVFTGAAEVYAILGFASFINWNLDLSSIAGILAAVGTGVDNQIVITDELLGERYQGAVQTSLVSRVKKAFFIITATAATAIATMSPIFFFGSSFGRLVGFAFTTIIGVLIGILVTRPAYAEIVKFLLSQEEKE